MKSNTIHTPRVRTQFNELRLTPAELWEFGAYLGIGSPVLRFVAQLENSLDLVIGRAVPEEIRIPLPASPIK